MTIHTGDCLEVMRTLPADSVDAICTDPPYGLEFMGKGWDKFGAVVEHPDDGEGPWGRTARVRFAAGTSFQAWCEAWGREALRVTKPGGYLLAFGGTRTHHRLVCGLEDAGWIIRDELTWVYASGFPKGRANLKPAHEPIVLARKPGPLRPLGIDAGRIKGPAWSKQDGDSGAGFRTGKFMGAAGVGEPTQQGGLRESTIGRWPSNVLLDPDSAALFDEPNPYVVGSGATVSSGLLKAGAPRDATVEAGKVAYGTFGGNQTDTDTYGDTGGYSRFFTYPRYYIVPKSSRADREPVVRGQLAASSENFMATLPDPRMDRPQQRNARENGHPTVKPVDLMRHLIRLVTPSGGTVLDPFLGSGSTAIAAELEGFPWIGIEKEPEYVAIAEARLNGTQRGMGLDVGAPTKARPAANDRRRFPEGRPYSENQIFAPLKGWSGGWLTDEEPVA